MAQARCDRNQVRNDGHRDEMGSRALQRQVALVNESGELVRTYQMLDENGESLPPESKITLLYRHDRRCIEPSVNVTRLYESGIQFDVLHETTAQELGARPYKIGTLGHMSFVDVKSLNISPSHELRPENDRQDLMLAGKWVGGVQLALILVTLFLGHFLAHETKKQEVVTTIRSVNFEKLAQVETKPFPKPLAPTSLKKEKAPIAKTIFKQKAKQKALKQEAPRVVTHRAPLRPAIQRKATAQVPKVEPKLESLGALGALGGLSKKMQTGGGLNLNGTSLSRGGQRGNGGGGVGSSGTGGVTGALFGKGLVAASSGSGARAGSVGGYGTKGRGGGREGYGGRSMLGSSGGYVLPLDGESFIRGGLTREQVEEVISRNMGQIRYCYEKGLQVEPSLRGRVALSFVIGSDGHVSTARVQHSSVESRQLEGCIVGRLKGFRFPRPVAGVNVQVQYPFSFRRASSTDVVGVN
jgi:outer membrane biosynthesis protein TonB